MLEWVCKKFDELTARELYNIMKLRSRVFVVEQQCIYLDADDKDPHCHHLMGIKEGQLVAYTRIVPPGISYAEPSIGRVVTSPDERKNGYGKILMAKSIETLYSLYGNTPIKIGAQLYLKTFYESFSFLQSSEIYLEDGIEHIEMLLK
ncbi:MAG TPA: GNAT family N-acetyltransferase [Puia sp.]|nr:GNAT family N-acetyltransferase [Puia sp.]